MYLMLFTEQLPVQFQCYCEGADSRIVSGESAIRAVSGHQLMLNIKFWGAPPKKTGPGW